MKHKATLLSGMILLYISTKGLANAIPLKDTPIAPGAGYSSDTQQIAPQYCYAVVASPLTDIEQPLKLTTAISFTDIQQQLHYNVSSKGGFGMFSASAEASYLKEIEDKDYSFSVNYLGYVEGTVSLQFKGAGLNALTSVGQDFYQNDYKNFGLMCGDNFVASYEEGALLAMSLNINFSSNYEKQQFESQAGGSFGNIFSASSQIQQIAVRNHLQGSVSLVAYQRGGDPLALTKILSKDSSGNYYILTCDMQHMDNCVKTANGLLSYATDNFPTQFSFKDNTGLTPLGLGFAQYKPMSYTGLTPPPSYVTAQVQADREALATAYSDAQYYVQNLQSLLQGYPVALDNGSDLYQDAQLLYKDQQSNLNVLLNSSDPDQGAMGCYDFPDQCDTLTQNLEAKLRVITGGDLGFLDPIHYYYQDAFATYYYNGTDWDHLNNPQSEDQILNIVDMNINDPNNINYHIYTRSSGPGGDGKQWDWFIENGVLQSDGKTIKANIRRVDSLRTFTAYRYVSPFYFGTAPEIK